MKLKRELPAELESNVTRRNESLSEGNVVLYGERLLKSATGVCVSRAIFDSSTAATWREAVICW